MDVLSLVFTVNKYWDVSSSYAPPIGTQYEGILSYESRIRDLDLAWVNFIKALAPGFFIGVKTPKKLCWRLKRHFFGQHVDSLSFCCPFWLLSCPFWRF